MKETTSKFRGYAVAIAAFIVIFMHQGALSSISIFMTPIAESNGFALGDVALMITFATAVAAIMSVFFAAPIIKKLTPKWTMFIASILGFTHFMMYSYATTLPVLYFAACIGGVLIALGTNATVTAIVGDWFIEKRALILGLIFGGAALGTSVWAMVGGYMITFMGYRMTYRVMATIMLVVGVALNLLIIRTPQQLGQKPLGWEKAEELAAASGEEGVSWGLSFQDAAKKPVFYIMLLGCALACMAWVAFRSYFASMLSQHGYSTIAASNFTAALNLIAAITVLLGGYISNKMGNKVYVAYLCICSVAASLILGIVGANPVIPMAVAVLVLVIDALAAPCQAALAPTVCTSIFGNKDYTKISIYLIAACKTGECLNPIIIKAVLGTGLSLNICYLIFAVVGAIGGILCLVGMNMSPLKNTEMVK